MNANLLEIKKFDQLRSLMIEAGATRLFFKRLAPNDNSKNQIYLGGDYSALQVLPYSDVTADISRTDSKRDRFKAKVKMQWLNFDGSLHIAPSAQLILYPKYPEVRLSGFIRGVDAKPKPELLSSKSRGEGRVLFFGTTPDDRIICHIIGISNPLNKELIGRELESNQGILIELPLYEHLKNTRLQLLQSLLNIHQKGWIDSVKLNREGKAQPYSALNGGGYTLEALLGVIPNGINEPDFLGWEIKQHKSPNLNQPLKGGALTLMTPEPTGGHYKTHGAEEFVRDFGYPDRNGISDRLNFGGVHKYGHVQALTGLRLCLTGFCLETGKIEDINGGIVLKTTNGYEAAVWHYKTLIEKWARKHAKAAYIPSQSRKSERPQYRYGHVIGLGERSNILHFLKAVSEESIYYDPGIKLENASSHKKKIKKRSQFRISPKNIPALYEKFEIVDLLEL